MDTAQHLPILTEEQEDRLPILCPIIDATGPHGLRLFIGNRVAADDGDLLLRNGITSTMNLAVNIELAPLALPDGTVIRRTHIGLIDGPGNSPQHLLSAVFALCGILAQQSPGKAHYPPHRRGNVLVHCRGGRSRSATVIALFLHLAHSEEFPTFQAALTQVRSARGLGEEQPQPAMIELALKALKRLGPCSTGIFRD